MAISKSIERSDGSALTYWKILWVKQTTWKNTNVQIGLGGFVSVDTRNNNMDCGEVKLYDFDTVVLLTTYASEVDAEPNLMFKPLKALYLGLLALSEWSGATEV